MVCDLICSRPRSWVYLISMYLFGIFAIVLMTSGVRWAAHFSEIFPNNRQNECTDTTCLLSVFGDKCYAKFEFYQDFKYELVSCNNQQLGFYNKTLPCDVGKDSKPIIYCEHRIMNKPVYILLNVFIAAIQFVFGICCAVFVAILHNKYNNYINSFSSDGYKKDPPPEDTKMVELDDV